MFTENLQSVKANLAHFLSPRAANLIRLGTMEDIWDQDQQQRENSTNGIVKIERINPIKIPPQASCASILNEYTSSSTASLTKVYVVSQAKKEKTAERMLRQRPPQTLQLRSLERLQAPKSIAAITETTRHMQLYRKPAKPALANSLSMMKRELFSSCKFSRQEPGKS